jgi:hypothetical protein
MECPENAEKSLTSREAEPVCETRPRKHAAHTLVKNTGKTVPKTFLYIYSTLFDTYHLARKHILTLLIVKSVIEYK